MTLLAETLTSGTWPDVTQDLRDLGADRTTVRHQLAQHFWCDLLVGLIRLLESSQRVAEAGIRGAPELMKEAVRDSSVNVLRPDVTDAVIDVVGDRVWAAFIGTALGGVPILDVLARDDVVRSLRVLAVFICPAPENHREVREHAMGPLGKDVERILTEQTKSRLADLFGEWAT